MEKFIVCIFLVATFSFDNSLSSPSKKIPTPKEFGPVANFSLTTIISYYADIEEFGGPIFELNWADSVTYCQERGMTLAKIDSQVENAYLANVLNNTFDGSHFWISAIDMQSEGNWRWLDGSEITYSNWNNNEPHLDTTANCATLHEDGGWRTQYCSDQYRPLCQIKQ